MLLSLPGATQSGGDCPLLTCKTGRGSRALQEAQRSLGFIRGWQWTKIALSEPSGMDGAGKKGQTKAGGGLCLLLCNVPVGLASSSDTALHQVFFFLPSDTHFHHFWGHIEHRKPLGSLAHGFTPQSPVALPEGQTTSPPGWRNSCSVTA